MKLSTWNVNGIRAREAQFLEWVTAEHPDIICLQEIKASQLQVPTSLLDLDGYWSYWHGLGGYSGVALHVRRKTFPAQPEFFHPDFDFENRIVAVKLPGVIAASVYVPNGGKDFAAKMRFLEQMEAYAKSARSDGTTLVLSGDINVARADIDVHPKERKPKAIGQLPEERLLLQRILDHGMADVCREQNPENDQLFSWWPPWRNMRQRNIGWRIDYILAGRTLADRCKSCVVEASVGTSDHAPVTAIFE